MKTNTISYANACANSVSTGYLGVPYNEFSLKNYQYAHSGNGYLIIKALNSNIPALVNSKKIYQEVQLTSSLKAGKKYFCGFYVVLTDSSRYATNNIAMSITKNMQVQDTSGGQNGNLTASSSVFNYGNPVIKDTQNWVLVSNVYTAVGGEQYITIGNFKDNAETSIDSSFTSSSVSLSLYCLDDVFVYELNSSYNLQANAGRDTTITAGDSAFIGTYTNGIDTVKWQVLNTNGTIDSIRPGFWVHPLVNTCYVLTQTVNGYTSSDTVCVTVNSLPLTMINYKLLMINEKQVENRWTTANEINVSHFYVQHSTTELSGGKDFKIIHKQQAENKTLNNYSYIDETPNEGLNYYRIVSVDKDGKTSFSEVRQLIINHSSLNINIYPNPAKDVVNIVGNSIKEIQIINQLGQVVYKEIATGTNLRNEVAIINTQYFNKGLYIVKVTTTKGEVKNEKLIIQ